MECALLAAGSVCEVTKLVIDETVRNNFILTITIYTSLNILLLLLLNILLLIINILCTVSFSFFISPFLFSQVDNGVAIVRLVYNYWPV